MIILANESGYQKTRELLHCYNDITPHCLEHEWKDITHRISFPSLLLY